MAIDILRLEDYNIYTGHIHHAIDFTVRDLAPSSVFVLVDENTERDCLPILKEYLGNTTLKCIKIPAGEIHKHIHTCQMIWDQLMTHQADRRALLINLGGGVIGDMGGFCASTYKRGIHFIQIPTTLLSQVDASIGGKLGIDFGGIKNSIGLFKNPKGVFIDPSFLKTLPDREIKSGFAEIIKHSLIADPAQWDKLSQYRKLSHLHWPDIIVSSLMIKRDVVKADPFEKGLRKALNFGHTIGHAIESYFLETQTPLLHGEAIAIGMICESYLSNQQIGLPDHELAAIRSFILDLYGHQQIPNMAFETLLKSMLNDKKNIGNQINFTLLPQIGQAKVNQTASNIAITNALTYYNQFG